MNCRIGCAACCVVISISSPVPGFPNGKPAGVRCQALGFDGRCTIWGTETYPQVCSNFRADSEYCGETNDEAQHRLSALEQATSAS